MNSTFAKNIDLIAHPYAMTKEIKDDYILKVKTQPKSLNVAAIAREVAARLGKYQQGEIELIVNATQEVITDAAASGYIVNLPLCLIQPTASGVVMKNELSQAVNRDKVKVSASFSPGAMMRQAMASAHLTLFLQPAVTGPLLNGAISTRTVTNDQGVATRAPLAAGEMCQLTGQNIKLVGTDPSVGILLTSVDDATKTHFIAPDRVSPNEPKTLQFILPAGMTDGGWTVRVTTQYSTGGHLIETPRSFVMDELLTLGEGGSGGGDIEDPTV